MVFYVHIIQSAMDRTYSQNGRISEHFQNLHVNRRTILEQIFKKVGVNTRKWIDTAQDRNYW